MILSYKQWQYPQWRFPPEGQILEKPDAPNKDNTSLLVGDGTMYKRPTKPIEKCPVCKRPFSKCHHDEDDEDEEDDVDDDFDDECFDF